MPDDEIVVIFDDAGGADNTGGKPAITGNGGKADDPDLVSDLRSQLSNMRTQVTQERTRATTAVQRAEQIAQQATKQVNDSRVDTIDSGIQAAKAAGDAAEQAYKTAFEAGDGDAMAKAQRAMSGAEARRVSLEQAKLTLDEMPTRRAAPRVDTPATPPSDPLERWIFNEGQPRSPETAAWARKHAEVVLNPRKMTKLTAAHYDAESEGIEVDTPEYFRHVEKFIGIEPANEATGREENKTTRRPGAPVIPADGGGGSGGGRQVKLTAGEKASATDGTLTWNYDDPAGKFKKGEPIGVQEFARRKLTMMEQGLYDKTLTAG